MAAPLDFRFDGAIKAPKLASVVARAIEDEVVAAGWPVGEVLGSESELLAKFGVSRAVLREAVRIVEHSGAARMRRGPGGGLVVAEPNREAVVAAISIWFSYVGITSAEIIEAWGPLSIHAVRLAAERRAPEAIEIRRRFEELTTEDDVSIRELAELDAQVAGLSGNPAIALFSRALNDIGMSRMRVETVEAIATNPTTRRNTLHANIRIIDAIITGDVDTAVEMTERLANAFSSRVPEPARRRRRRDGQLPGAGKLAERVAEALRDDIERAGWPIGEVLGSEVDLTERYGVSRAILREAVRILEHHGAVRTKRGPHGGLVVSAPDSDAVVRAARLVLEHDGVTPAGLLEMRSAVELAVVRLAAERCTPEDAEALRTTLEAEEHASLAALNFHDLHADIARVARNRALALFVDVAAALVQAHISADQRSPEGLAQISDVVHTAHARLVDAIVAGDTAAAERRMARHLCEGVQILQ